MVLIRTDIEQEMENIRRYAKSIIEADETVDGLYTKLKTDKELFRHSKNVALIGIAIGTIYGFNLNEKIDLYMGGILHDIGKLYLDREILYKPKIFDENDRIFVESHPHYGYRKLKDTSVSGEVLDIIKNHHERMDGKGYPDSLRARDISIYTQIISAADVFDAMTAVRCYHRAIPKEEAIATMKSNGGLNQVAISIINDFVEVSPNKHGNIIKITTDAPEEREEGMTKGNIISA